MDGINQGVMDGINQGGVDGINHLLEEGYYL